MPCSQLQQHWLLKLTMMDVVQVHAATRRVAATPASPEDFAGLLGFLEELEERRQGLDKAYDLVCLFLGHCAHISIH